MNEVVANTILSMTSTDKSPFDKDFYKRGFVKLTEFNQIICTENDETNREEKWENWVKQQKQMLYGTNEVINITNIGHEEYQKKVKIDETFSILIIF